MPNDVDELIQQIMDKPKKKKVPWVTLIMGLIFTLAGYSLLYIYTRSWQLCLAVLLITMGNNIDEKHKLGFYDKNTTD